MYSKDECKSEEQSEREKRQIDTKWGEGGMRGESTSLLTNTEKGVSWTFGKQEAIHNHLGEECGDPGLRAKTTQGEGVRSVSGLARDDTKSISQAWARVNGLRDCDPFCKWLGVFQGTSEQ